ncbi:hypothetical protein B566_EDAN009049 [Ephemera danica]|nr:hypothetical protein B566_EDAN009049 [Ephemera danica]
MDTYEMWASLPILLFVTFTAVTTQDDACSNAPLNSTAGFCVNIHTCPPVLEMLKEKPLRQMTIEKLQKSQCGFEGTTPKVCIFFISANS